MPLYEYECEADGHRFEVIQKFSDPPVTICPDCGAAVRRLLSSPAIQFKGSGWYITDYARKGKSDAGRDRETNAGKDRDTNAGKDRDTKAASSGDTAKPAADSTPAPKPSSSE